jgi:hypothetical protein
MFETGERISLVDKQNYIKNMQTFQERNECLLKKMIKEKVYNANQCGKNLVIKSKLGQFTSI